MRERFDLNVILLVLATSYLTLGIADTRAAERLWAVYAVVTLAFALANLSTGKR